MAPPITRSQNNLNNNQDSVGNENGDDLLDPNEPVQRLELNALRARVNRLDTQLGQVDAKVDSINSTANQTQGHLTVLADQVNNIEGSVTDIGAKLDQLLRLNGEQPNAETNTNNNHNTQASQPNNNAQQMDEMDELNAQFNRAAQAYYNQQQNRAQGNPIGPTPVNSRPQNQVSRAAGNNQQRTRTQLTDQGNMQPLTPDFSSPPPPQLPAALSDSKPAQVYTFLCGNSQRTQKGNLTKVVDQYDGTSSEPFQTWLHRYELGMVMNGASAAEITACIGHYLTGFAFTIYNSLPLPVLCDYAALRTALSERLNPRRSYISTWLPVMNFTQHRNESVRDLYMRLVKETQFLDSTAESEQTLTVAFLKAMKPELYDNLGSIDDMKLTSILARAQEVEARFEYRRSLQQAYGRPQVPAPFQRNTPLNANAANTNSQRYGASSSQQSFPPQRAIAPAPTAQSATANTGRDNNMQQPQAQLNRNMPSTFQGTCNLCGKHGHRAANCRQRPNDNRRPQATLQEVQFDQSDEQLKEESDADGTDGTGLAWFLEQANEGELDAQDASLEEATCEEAQSVESSDPSHPTAFAAPSYTPNLEGVPFTGKLDSAAEVSVLSRHKLQELSKLTGRDFPEYECKLRLRDYSGRQLACNKYVLLSISDNDLNRVEPFLVDEHAPNKVIYGSYIFYNIFKNVVTKTPYAVSFNKQQKPVTATVVEIKKAYKTGSAIVKLEMQSTSQPGVNGEQVFFSTTDSLPDAVVSIENGCFYLPCKSIDDALLLSQSTNVGQVCEVNINPNNRLPLDWSGSNDSEPYKQPDPLKTMTFAHDFTTERVEALRDLLGPAVHEQTGLDKQQFLNWLLERADYFAINDSELGECNVLKHNIDTGGKPPFKDPPRKYSPAQKQIMMQIVGQWIKGGIVEPSTSPYCSQLLLVPKPDPIPGDAWRLCCDMRTLNAQTVDDAMPLMPCSEVLARLGEAKAIMFSKLDCKSGFLQLMLDEESKAKTAFATPGGLYQFKRVAFGLTTALQSFNRAITTVLSKFVSDPRVCVYVDDILLATKSVDEMWSLIAEVMDLLHKANIRLGPAKCKFFADQVSFLGHSISRDGIAADPKKTKAVTDYPQPTTAKGLMSFLGLVNYLRPFSVPLSDVATPLYDAIKGKMTKNSTAPIDWTPELAQAFLAVKRLICAAPVMIMPNPDKVFIIESDASNTGLGAALLQESDTDNALHPITFANRKLNAAQRNYSATMRECLGVVWSLNQFSEYVAGHPIVIYTDHIALLSLKTKKDLPHMLSRWALLIDQHNPTIRYRPGRLNQLADAMSRKSDHEQARCAITKHYQELSDLHKQYETHGFTDTKKEQFRFGSLPAIKVAMCEALVTQDEQKTRQAQTQDGLCGNLIRYLESNELPDDEKKAKSVAAQAVQYEMLNGLLHRAPDRLFRARLVVPRQMRSELIHEHHSMPTAGHQRAQKTYERLRLSYWWPGMLADVTYALDQCRLCATRSGTARKQKPALQCPVVSPFPMEKAAMDLCQFPPATSGAKYMLVIIDVFTKYVQTYALTDKTAQSVARCLVDYVCRFGVVKQLLTDNGREFVNDLASQVEKLMGIKHIRTTTYHPQANGEAERMNREFCKMLAMVVNKAGSDWDQYLPLLTFAYNSTPHTSTGRAPYEMLFGRDANLPSALAVSEHAVPAYARMADELDFPQELAMRLREIWQMADQRIKAAQRHYKEQYDKNTRPIKITVGSKVMVLRPQALQGDKRKFARPYSGPFRVVAHTTTNAQIVPCDNPTADPETIHLDKLSPAPDHLRDQTWLGDSNRKQDRREPVPRPRDTAQQ